MKITKRLGILFLAIWLIVSGVLSIIPIQIPGAGFILALLAILAGVLLLLDK